MRRCCGGFAPMACGSGSATWRDPEELYHVAVIASEVGEALRDVDHVLKPLEASGLIVLYRLKASFEGAERRTLLGSRHGRGRGSPR